MQARHFIPVPCQSSRLDSIAFAPDRSDRPTTIIASHLLNPPCIPNTLSPPTGIYGLIVSVIITGNISLPVQAGGQLATKYSLYSG